MHDSTIISPDAADGALGVHQETRFYAGLFDGAERAEFSLPAGRYAYVHVARGTLRVNGTAMQAGDGARLRDLGTLRFDGGQDAEVLLFDLRAVELPTR
jgi:redox-sensitive bicupin YhaK (pirin superfamily)